MKFFWALPGEKEQPRDFSKCSDDELLNQFRTENWEKMPRSKDRVALLQEMENRFAARQGRTPAKVEELKTGSYYGAYNDMSGRLQVNVQDFSSYEVLDTYIHEANHAYQHHCVETGSGMREDVRLMMQAELARDDRGRLYNYASTSPEYDMQCDELDSNNRAGAFVLSQAQRYGDDPAFEAYVKERANHFREVNHDLTHRDGLRQAMQERQTDVAYIRGDLSEEQYQTLRENLADENRVDPTAETSKELGAAFAQAEAYYAAQAERDQAMQAPQAASSAQDAPAPDGEMKAAARMSGMDSAGETVHARVLTLGGRDVIHVNYQDRMDRLQGDYEQWAQSERAYAAELHSRSAAVLNDSSLSPNEQKTALLQIKREALIHAQEAREDYESFRSEYQNLAEKLGYDTQQADPETRRGEEAMAELENRRQVEQQTVQEAETEKAEAETEEAEAEAEEAEAETEEAEAEAEEAEAETEEEAEAEAEEAEAEAEEAEAEADQDQKNNTETYRDDDLEAETESETERDQTDDVETRRDDDLETETESERGQDQTSDAEDYSETDAGEDAQSKRSEDQTSDAEAYSETDAGEDAQSETEQDQTSDAETYSETDAGEDAQSEGEQDQTSDAETYSDVGEDASDASQSSSSEASSGSEVSSGSEASSSSGMSSGGDSGGGSSSGGSSGGQSSSGQSSGM